MILRIAENQFLSSITFALIFHALSLLYPHPIKNPDYAHAPAYLFSKELNKYGTKTALYDNKGVRIVIKILKISIFVISPSVSKSGQLLTNSKLKSRVQVQADPVFIKIGFSDQPAGQKLLVIY